MSRKLWYYCFHLQGEILLLSCTVTVKTEDEGSLLPGCLPCSVASNFNFGLQLRSLSSYLIDYREGEIKIPTFDFMASSYLSDLVNSHPLVFISFCLISSSVNGKSLPRISLSFTLIYQTFPKTFTYHCLQYHSCHFGKWQIWCHLFPNCSVCPNFFSVSSYFALDVFNLLNFLFLIIFL